MKFQLKSQGFQLSNPALLLKIVCICWVITKIICYKLWLAYRFFPVVPVHEALQNIPAIFHSILLAISLIGMAAFCILPSKKIITVIFICELLSCLLDQNRWQPWEYQFVCMAGAYIFIKDKSKIILCWQLILVSLYFFSGLNKCHPYFIYNVWNNFLLKNFAGISVPSPWLLKAGYSIPLIEMIAGIALCFNPTRKLAVWILCGMHVFNLFVLGPAGLNINEVIWPWNILMPFLLIGMFYKEPIHIFKSISLKPVYNILILIAWWILPWLQLVGNWDKYLSGVLYSGRVEHLFICSNSSYIRYRLSDCFVKANKNMECDSAISAYKWGMQEMNSAPYPEKRVYEAIAASFNKLDPKAVNHFYLYQGGFTKKITELLPRK